MCVTGRAVTRKRSLLFVRAAPDTHRFTHSSVSWQKIMCSPAQVLAAASAKPPQQSVLSEGRLQADTLDSSSAADTIPAKVDSETPAAALPSLSRQAW